LAQAILAPQSTLLPLQPQASPPALRAPRGVCPEASKAAMGAWRRSRSDVSTESNAPGCCERPCSLACRCSCAAIVALLVLVGMVFLTAHMDRCGSDQGYLGGMKPNNGGKEENAIVFAHRVGFVRNFVEPIADVVPWYRGVEFSAAPEAGGSPRVALTFNDALVRSWPNELDGFEALLGVLSALDVRATFFVIGNHATLSPRGIALLRQASESGHEIGNFGTADHAHDVLSEDQFRDLIELWEYRITSALGGNWPAREGDLKWFRPPKGRMSAAMAKVLEEKGYSISLPDVFSVDHIIEDPVFHARILANAPCDGSVLMIHAPDPDSWGTQSIQVVSEVVPVLRERGFELEPLSELFRETGDVKMERKALGFFMLALIPLALFSCACAGCCCLRALCCGFGRRKHESRSVVVVGSPRRRDEAFDEVYAEDSRDFDDRRYSSPRRRDCEGGYCPSPRGCDDGYCGSPSARSNKSHFNESYYGSPHSRRYA